MLSVVYRRMEVTQMGRVRDVQAYTRSEAATRLGVDVSTIDRWAERGQLQEAATTGGQRLFERDSVETLFKARKGK